MIRALVLVVLIAVEGCSSPSSEAVQIEFDGRSYYGAASGEYAITSEDVERIGAVESATPEELAEDPVFALEGVDPEVAVAVSSDYTGQEAYHVFWRSGGEYPGELCTFVREDAVPDECVAATQAP